MAHTCILFAMRSSLLSDHKRQFEESNIPKDWESSNDDSDSVASNDGESDIDSVDGDSVVSWDGSVDGQSDVVGIYGDNKGPSNKVRRSNVSQTYFINHQNHHRFVKIASKDVFPPECTVRLTSIDYPQIEGKFTATTGGLTNLFYGCKD